MYIMPTDEDDPGKALAVFKDMLDKDMLNQPAHVQKKAKFAEFACGWELPSDQQKFLLALPPFVEAGGLSWSSDQAQRIQVVQAIKAAMHHALKPDIWDMLDWLPGVKLWLAGWQRQVNSGQCWNLPGRFGMHADMLLDLGALLHSPARIEGWYGQMYPTREEVEAGKSGSAYFVIEKMGRRYYDWIEDIRDDRDAEHARLGTIVEEKPA
jgi:hypothetical protein